MIEKIKSAHARAQVHDKNVKVVGGMKHAGFVSGIALKQLIRTVEKLDKRVKDLDFPVVPPYNVGQAGSSLISNPNFGPFVPLTAPITKVHRVRHHSRKSVIAQFFAQTAQLWQ